MQGADEMTPGRGRPVKDTSKGPVGKAWSFRLQGGEDKLLQDAWESAKSRGYTKQEFLRELILTGVARYNTFL